MGGARGWRLILAGDYQTTVLPNISAFENILNIASVFFELIENEAPQVSSSCWSRG